MDTDSRDLTGGSGHRTTVVLDLGPELKEI
jgi:hypothetical protein